MRNRTSEGMPFIVSKISECQRALTRGMSDCRPKQPMLFRRWSLRTGYLTGQSSVV